MSLKAGCAVIALTMLAFAPSVMTPADAATRCGAAPVCEGRGLNVKEMLLCKARRSEAEADCQARGKGDAKGDRGKGRKFTKCKNTAQTLREAAGHVDSADDGDTLYSEDCK